MKIDKADAISTPVKRVRYIEFMAENAASVANNALFCNVATGKLSKKSNAGTVTAIPTPGNFRMATGTYTGGGTSITFTTGFRPIRVITCPLQQYYWYNNRNDHPGTNGAHNGNNFGGGITSFSDTGFTTEHSQFNNDSGVQYTYLALGYTS